MSDIWQQTWGLQATNALPGLDLAWRTHWALLDIWTANQLGADELNLRTQNWSSMPCTTRRTMPRTGAMPV
jgi:hypothetical protein